MVITEVQIIRSQSINEDHIIIEGWKQYKKDRSNCHASQATKYSLKIRF